MRTRLKLFLRRERVPHRKHVTGNSSVSHCMNHSQIQFFTRIILGGVYNVPSYVALRVFCYFHNLILVCDEIILIPQMCREDKNVEQNCCRELKNTKYQIGTVSYAFFARAKLWWSSHTRLSVATSSRTGKTLTYTQRLHPWLRTDRRKKTVRYCRFTAT